MQPPPIRVREDAVALLCAAAADIDAVALRTARAADRLGRAAVGEGLKEPTTRAARALGELAATLRREGLLTPVRDRG